MVTGFGTISDIMLFWAQCEDTFLTEAHLEQYKPLQKPLTQLYALIIEYQAKAICHLSKSQLNRAWQKVTGPEEWAAKETKLRSASEDCKAFIGAGLQKEARKRADEQLKVMKSAYTVQQDILNTMRQGEQDKHERQLLQDLSSVCPTYASDKDFNPVKAPGTCEWFIKDEQFLEWRYSSSSTVLWVSAGPGCGKSVLARSLIDVDLSTNTTSFTLTEGNITEENVQTTVCYFFFKDGAEGRTTASNALSAILHQLFASQAQAELIKYAMQAHRNFGDSLTTNFPELWNILFACAASKQSGNIVCVLDALDECNGKSRRDLITKLQELYLSNSCPKLKFLITSRPYDDIKLSLQPSIEAARYVHFDADDKTDAISEDINLVIDMKVDHFARHFSSNDKRRISTRLKSMGTRTYLWLHLTFEIMEESPSEYSRQADIEDLLADIPLVLSDAYEKILSRVKNPARTKTFFEILLAAREPLRTAQANEALSLALAKQNLQSYAELKERMWRDEDFETIVKNLCGLFVNVYEGKIFFIHLTAKEFLTGKLSSTTQWRGILHNEQLLHSHMARYCIRYLLFPDIPTIDRLSYNLGNYPGKYSFLAYAGNFWDLHYECQDMQSKDRCREDGLRLCDPTGVPVQRWGFKLVMEGKLCPIAAWTSLAIASYSGLSYLVEAILSEDSEHIDGWCGTFGTALQAASHQGHLDVVQVLLQRGANVNHESGIYGTALVAAARRGQSDVCKFLLENGAKVNYISPRFGTALHGSLAFGDAKTVPLLFSHGADLAVGSEFQYDFKISDAWKVTLDLGHVPILSTIRLAQNMFHTDDKAMILRSFDIIADNVDLKEKFLRALVGESAYDMVLMMYEKRRKNFIVTQAMLSTAAAKCDVPMMNFLWDKRDENLVEPSELWKAASRNRTHSSQLVQLLLSEEYALPVTQTSIELLLGSSPMPLSIVKLALMRCIDKPAATAQAVSLSAAQHDLELTRLVLDHADVRVEEIILNVAIDCDESTLAFLLNKCQHGSVDADDIIVSCLQTNMQPTPLLRLVLDWSESDFVLSDRIIQSAIANRLMPRDALDYLMERAINPVVVSPEILYMAVEHANTAVIECLLSRYDSPLINIAPAMLRATMKNRGFIYREGVIHIPVIEQFISKCPEFTLCTEDLVLEALNEGHQGLFDLQLLAYLKGIPMEITEAVLLATVKLKGFTATRFMKFFIQQLGGKIRITDAMLEALVMRGNGDFVIELVHLGCLESLPPKYLEMIKLHSAAAQRDKGGIRELKARGAQFVKEVPRRI